MILSVDVGNTNISIGAYEAENRLFVCHILTEPDKTEVEYAMLFHHILHLHRQSEQDLKGAIISSVVPPLSPVLKAALQLCRGRTGAPGGAGHQDGAQHPHRQSRAARRGLRGRGHRRDGPLSAARHHRRPRNSDENFGGGPLPHLYRRLDHAGGEGVARRAQQPGGAASPHQPRGAGAGHRHQHGRQHEVGRAAGRRKHDRRDDRAVRGGRPARRPRSSRAARWPTWSVRSAGGKFTVDSHLRIDGLYAAWRKNNV